MRDRTRFWEIARGSALESAAIQNALIASQAMVDEMNQELRIKLVRIVSMLTPMAMKFENTSKPERAYALSFNYDYEQEPEHRLWLSTDRKQLVSPAKLPEEPKIELRLAGQIAIPRNLDGLSKIGLSGSICGAEIRTTFARAQLNTTPQILLKERQPWIWRHLTRLLPAWI